MRHVLTRQQLYDMIWERAVSKVAPELGISDVALRKQCMKHAIPLPDAIYGGRLHAGCPVKRKPLGVAPKDVSDRIVIDARTKQPASRPSSFDTRRNGNCSSSIGRLVPLSERWCGWGRRMRMPPWKY